MENTPNADSTNLMIEPPQDPIPCTEVPMELSQPSETLLPTVPRDEMPINTEPAEVPVDHSEAGNTPNDRDAPNARPKRNKQPPAWLKDYVCN